MSIEIAGMLHAGYRIGTDGGQVDTIVEFYKKVFQLDIDPNRPHIPTIPGAWIQLPESQIEPQVHLFVANGVSPAARSQKEDPTRTHVAFAVRDLSAAKAHLQGLGVEYWEFEGLVGPDQVFLEDPAGNMLELQEAE